MADEDYGLTATGFVIQTEEDIVEEIRDDLRAEFGPEIEPGLVRGLLYRLIRIFAERIGSVWELGEAINSSQNPNAATGVSLDSLSALTGTQRQPATSSTVVLTLGGNNGTSIASGSQASTAAGDRFATTVGAVLANLVAWAPATAYSVGARRSNASRSYEVITAGTSAGSGGPTTDDDDITDNTVHWQFIGEGTAVADVNAASVETGEIVGSARGIITIETNVGGWQSVINLEDADLGQVVESDAALRSRRANELERAGASTVDAIRIDVTDALDTGGFPGAIVTVFENATNATNSDGLPPHSVEVLVQSDAGDQLISDAVLAAVAAGIEMYGTTTASSVDAAGNTHVVKFTRPDEIEIYVAATIRVQDDDEANDYPDEATWPTDGEDQVKAAIVAFGDTFAVSRSVYASRVGREALIDSIGVIDLTACTVGLAASPVALSVAIGSRQIAVFSTTRIALTVVSG